MYTPELSNVYISFQSGGVGIEEPLRRRLWVNGTPEMSKEELWDPDADEDAKRLERPSCHSLVGTTESPRSKVCGFKSRE